MSKKFTGKSQLLCLLFLFLTAALSGQQTQFAFEYITNNNGLTHNTVYDICQDDKGFMWFATEVGLNRYDGQNIKQYHHIPEDNRSLPSSAIQSLIYTSDSKLFAGTNAGLAVYHPETDDFERISFVEKQTVIRMKQGHGRELLISTNEDSFIYNYINDSISKLKADNRLYGIITDNEDTYWGFSRFALYRFNRKGEQIAAYRVSSQLFASAISYIRIDKRGTLWVGTFDNGLFTFDSKRNEFKQLVVSKEIKMYYIRTIEESETAGEYWIGTENGLYIINIETNDYKHYTQSFDNKHKTINDNAVYKIYRNKQGIFFMGTYFGGVNIANTRHIGFNAILPDNEPGDLHGKAISMIAKAPNGNLWMATEDAGIVIFDKENDRFRHLLFDEKDPNSISTNNVQSLLMDEKNCWAGHFMGGISKIEIATGKAKRLIQKAGNPKTLNNNFVFALHFLSPDSILAGTLSGVELFDKRSETFSRFRQNEFADCFIYCIFTAPDGKIWFCTSNKGIYVLDRTKQGLMTHFQAGDGSGLTSNSIISYCIDSKGQILVGTRYSGLLKYIANENRFEACQSGMLIDNIIYGIVEDDEGFFWISTNKGISRLNFEDSTAVHFNVKHGLAGNQHNYKSYFKDNGIIYFGSVTGLTWFNPKTISVPHETPSVYFTNLRIFNKLILPDSTGLLQQQIDFTRQLTLKHNQNSFTLDYASINYFSNDISYQYYLEGFDDVWSPLGNKEQANYTKVAPGNYVFHIRAVNMLNNSVSEERTLHITVKPPYWASWPAYFLYAALLWGIGYYVYRNYRNRQHEKMALAIEKIEKENLKLLHQHKMNFFTYISHEFKTPLSIISASIEMLFRKEGASENEILQSIKHSANRLLHLVNQLMEFRKIETDHAVIHITRGNVIDFSNQIINAYRPLLEKKNIKLNVKVSYIEPEIFFDFDKLEKIITNLLTNAIKYTPQNGSIGFVLNVDSEQLQFSVEDSGGGISEKKKDKIFEVFYSDGFSNDVVESSGIGLALTASLVKLLKGEITVDSEAGKGSKFNVKLPYGENAPVPSADEAQAAGITSNDIITRTDDTAVTAKDNTAEDNKEYRLVIAEDNKDLLMLLFRNFKEKYHVKCFDNGKEAWEYINHKMPDILISDIMMPAMSGTELCQKIKTDVNLCHIPVVMLTAKDAKEAKLEGLQVGADAYITKPFSMTELEIRLSNILNNQKALKHRLKELARFEGFDIPVTNHEQAFVEKMLAIVQNNMEKSELDVQFIANELNISRSTLHNKMKTSMNMNASEFINTVRINKAKELILEDSLNFSEITYKVGYSDSAYFTRIFKKYTGKTPGEYKKEFTKINDNKRLNG
jgi:signal transduction histidine kinase/ligand-binding sensor domain-containing protein/DNA-binding response OmpR family regulator